jgi:hypothetical protein
MMTGPPKVGARVRKKRQENCAMDRWDVLIVVVAAYVSVVSLVRLMAHRRDELVAKIRDEIAKQQAAAAAAKAANEEDAEQEAA